MLYSDMSLFDKAKALSSKAVEKIADFSSDELIADTVMKAVEKQEKVNFILQQRGSKYRVSGMDLEMGVPPKVVFGIRRMDDISKSTEEEGRHVR